MSLTMVNTQGCLSCIWALGLWRKQVLWLGNNILVRWQCKDDYCPQSFRQRGEVCTVTVGWCHKVRQLQTVGTHLAMPSWHGICLSHTPYVILCNNVHTHLHTTHSHTTYTQSHTTQTHSEKYTHTLMHTDLQVTHNTNTHTKIHIHSLSCTQTCKSHTTQHILTKYTLSVIHIYIYIYTQRLTPPTHTHTRTESCDHRRKDKCDRISRVALRQMWVKVLR